MEKEDGDALKAWKAALTGSVYSLLIRTLSLNFLRVRAPCYEP